MTRSQPNIFYLNNANITNKLNNNMNDFYTFRKTIDHFNGNNCYINKVYKNKYYG